LIVANIIGLLVMVQCMNLEHDRSFHKTNRNTMASTLPTNSTTGNAQTAAVIGSGWTGLIATKHLKEAGIECVCYEASGSIGGIWKQAKEFGSTASSSRSYLSSSDYPFSDEASMFPTADEVMDHIQGYVEHFDLFPLIRFHSTVTSVRFDKGSDKWIVEVTSHNESVVRRFDKLVSATGLCGKPWIPVEASGIFPGIPSVHSAELTKYNTPSWCKQDSTTNNSCVLVVGGGESATDVASSLASQEDCGQIVLSLRTGRWFLPNMKPPRETIPADLASRRTFKLMSYVWFQHLFDRYLLKILGKGAHGVEAWVPDETVTSWGCFLNKRSDQILPHVRCNKILPVAGIKYATPSSDGKNIQVEFECGTSCSIRGVIWCTGYKRVSLVPEDLAVGPEDSLLHVFPGHNESTYGKIAYIGAARPNLGAIPSLAEYASLWMSRVFSGQSELPPFSSVPRLVAQQTLDRLRKFPRDGQKIPELVHSVDYTDSVLRCMGATFPVSLLPPIDIFWTYPLPEALRAYRCLCSAPWSNLELAVVCNAEGRGTEVRKSIEASHAAKKTMDPDVFLKTFVGDAVGDYSCEVRRVFVHKQRLALLVVAFLGAVFGCK